MVVLTPELLGGPPSLDTALNMGEVEPDFYTAEMRAFGADGRGDAGTEMAGWADIAGKFRMHFTDLGDFVHRSVVDFLLGVETGAHGPFVKEMQKRARLDEADGFGVG